MGKQNSPCDLGAYLAESQQEGNNLKDLIKQLSSHGKSEKHIDKMLSNFRCKIKAKHLVSARNINNSQH